VKPTDRNMAIMFQVKTAPPVNRSFGCATRMKKFGVIIAVALFGIFAVVPRPIQEVSGR